MFDLGLLVPGVLLTYRHAHSPHLSHYLILAVRGRDITSVGTVSVDALFLKNLEVSHMAFDAISKNWSIQSCSEFT